MLGGIQLSGLTTLADVEKKIYMADVRFDSLIRFEAWRNGRNGQLSQGVVFHFLSHGIFWNGPLAIHTGN